MEKQDAQLRPDREAALASEATVCAVRKPQPGKEIVGPIPDWLHARSGPRGVLGVCGRGNHDG